MDYEEYIKIVLQNPISAIVKMMDLQDNLRVIDLIELNEDNYKRSRMYLSYIYIINDIYHFLENIKAYKDELKGEPKMSFEDLLKMGVKVDIVDQTTICLYALLIVKMFSNILKQ